jgi:hypothetical protein
MSQLRPKITMAMDAPPASSELATGGKMNVMASVSTASAATPISRE